MKLSLKVEYACQVMAQLGYSYGKDRLPHIEELSKAENIPSNYLVQILNDLRTQGLISSRRGKQGGYTLTRKPADITLLSVVEAMDGELLSHSSGGKGQSSAKTETIWQDISDRFREEVSRYTISDFMNHEIPDMWYI